MGENEDERVFASLFERHHTEVWRYLARRSGPSAADDLAAEVFEVAWRRFDELPTLHQRAWLFGTARNTLMAYWRTVGRSTSLPTDLPGHGEDVTEGVHTRDEALRALSRLSARDAELLRLVAWEGLEGAELAAALGCSRGTAAVRLHRARRRLETAFEPSIARPPSALPTGRTHDVR